MIIGFFIWFYPIFCRENVLPVKTCHFCFLLISYKEYFLLHSTSNTIKISYLNCTVVILMNTFFLCGHPKPRNVKKNIFVICQIFLITPLADIFPTTINLFSEVVFGTVTTNNRLSCDKVPKHYFSED